MLAASMTVEQLHGVALGLNSAVVGSLKSAEWNELQATAFAETKLEVEKGWFSDCSELNLKWHFVAKIFAISQTNKQNKVDRQFFHVWRQCHGRIARETPCRVSRPNCGHCFEHDGN